MKQVGGDHYEQMDIQPWDALKAWMTREQFAGFMLGTAQVYLARFNANVPGKGGLTDVKKAIHHLTKLVEVEEKHMEQTAPDVGLADFITPATMFTAAAGIVAPQRKGRPL